MGRTVEELFHGSPCFRPISGKEYRAWLRHYQRIPWGAARGDLQAGIVARVIYASNGVKSPPLDAFLIEKKQVDKRKFSRTALEGLATVLGTTFTPAQGGNDGE